MSRAGMMSDNMFVGKAVLLDWLNANLKLRLDRIEDTCTGAVACQLMDCLHPGSVNMRKVDFNVKNDYEFVGNYKELQQGFNKMGIDRAFNVASLSKGKLQDNNEFMQWFKGYWDSVTGGGNIDDYDAVGRRQVAKTGDWKKFSLVGGAVPPASGTIAAVRRGPAPAAPRAGTSGAKVPLRPAAAKPRGAGGAEAAQLAAQVADLTEQLAELSARAETAERERDFYFDKLRDVELLCQAPEVQDIPAIKVVEKVLYASDSAEAKEAMSSSGLAIPEAPAEPEAVAA